MSISAWWSAGLGDPGDRDDLGLMLQFGARVYAGAADQ